MAVSSEEFNEIPEKYQSLYYTIEEKNVIEFTDPPKPWTPDEEYITNILRHFQYPEPWQLDTDWEADITDQLMDATAEWIRDQAEWIKDQLDTEIINNIVEEVEKEKEIVESIIPKKMFEV